MLKNFPRTKAALGMLVMLFCLLLMFTAYIEWCEGRAFHPAFTLLSSMAIICGFYFGAYFFLRDIIIAHYIRERWRDEDKKRTAE